MQTWRECRLLFHERVYRKAAHRLPRYDRRNWLRVRQTDAFAAALAERPDGSVLEVSPGWNWYWRNRCRNYRGVDYPDFDICLHRLPEQFDTVIVDQVLEHVARPLAAVQNVFAMVKPGGRALVATPFLFRVHARPHDYSRWTEAGLRQLLIDGGFSPDLVATEAWGNKACVRAHVGGPVLDYGYWRRMKNDPEYPIMVWAVARREG